MIEEVISKFSCIFIERSFLQGNFVEADSHKASSASQSSDSSNEWEYSSAQIKIIQETIEKVYSEFLEDVSDTLQEKKFTSDDGLRRTSEGSSDICPEVMKYSNEDPAENVQPKQETMIMKPQELLNRAEMLEQKAFNPVKSNSKRNRFKKIALEKRKCGGRVMPVGREDLEQSSMPFESSKLSPFRRALAHHPTLRSQSDTKLLECNGHDEIYVSSNSSLSHIGIPSVKPRTYQNYGSCNKFANGSFGNDTTKLSKY